MEEQRNIQFPKSYWDLSNKQKIEWLRRAERDLVNRYGLADLGSEVEVPDTVDLFLMTGQGWENLSPENQRIYFWIKRWDLEIEEPEDEVFLVPRAAPAQFFTPVEDPIIQKFMRENEVTDLSDALQLAASKGRLDIVRILLRNKDINTDDVLLFASMWGRPRVVKELLRDPRFKVDGDVIMSTAIEHDDDEDTRKGKIEVLRIYSKDPVWSKAALYQLRNEKEGIVKQYQEKLKRKDDSYYKKQYAYLCQDIADGSVVPYRLIELAKHLNVYNDEMTWNDVCSAVKHTLKP